MKKIQRLMSLDVFRGLTIALMIIVNSPGTLMPYSLLEHATWNGCTLADLVFPFFIVIVGISSVLVLSTLKENGVSFSRLFEKILRRSIYIFIMGLILNVFPHHFDLSSLRILGVLQRIAICYFISSVLFLTTRIQTQAIIGMFILVGYACLLTFLTQLGYGSDSLSLEGNLVGYFDRLVFSPRHLYTPLFDPEGLLSTLPAIASTLLGNMIGVLLLSSRTKALTFQWMIWGGVILSGLGWIWSYFLPMNKALWSSSYVLWTGGLSLLTYAVLYVCIEIKQWIRWFKPFELFGRHAMLVYMLHVLFLKIQAMIHIQNIDGTVVNFRLYITNVLFGHFSPQNASLFYSIGYTMIWMFVLIGVTIKQQRRRGLEQRMI